MTTQVADGQYVFDNLINAILHALQQNAVISGMAVTERSEGANMSVDVAAGVYRASGTKVTKGSKTNVAIAAADATNPRKDIIVADSAGNITAVTGTPEAADPSNLTGPETLAPKPEDIPTGKIILAEVWVGAGVTQVNTADVTDRRVVISDCKFTDLSDTPAAYTGKAAYSPVINSGETALEWAKRGSISTTNKTISVDKEATGAADGTSWADAFTTIQDAVNSMEDIITHAYAIRVRARATPYRETVYLNSSPATNPAKLIVGSLAIRGEYYWHGDCEANVGGAGEITDTAAFADVLVGDKVLVMDMNGANGRCQNYEICTVDSIANIPNRIGTDGALTPTTNWDYMIVRTEVSGSDDDTDGGTARDACFDLENIGNVTIQGFYLTFSDSYALDVLNCGNIKIYDLFFDDCDGGQRVRNSTLSGSYIYIETSVTWGSLHEWGGQIDLDYIVVDATGAGFGIGECLAVLNYFYIDNSTQGLNSSYRGVAYVWHGTISGNTTIGIYVRFNAAIRFRDSTNSATTPEDPVGTSEGAYIG